MIKAKATGAKNIWQSHIRGNGYMGISLHSHNHQGEGLKAMIQWINEQTDFDFVRIGLSDTLNRHNYVMEENIHLHQAHEKSKKMGQKWLDENKSILERLTVPFEIIRWDYWLIQHADQVIFNKKTFYDTYFNNLYFNSAVKEDLSNYFMRHGKTSLSSVDSKKLSLSLEYLMEELAVYSILFTEYPSTAIYPGKSLKCFEIIRQSNIPNVPQGINKSKFIRLSLHGEGQFIKAENISIAA